MSERCLEGWLRKRGAINKAWKRRFFKLHDGKLLYFKSRQQTAPQGTVDLRDCALTIDDTPSYRLFIKSPHFKRVYELEAGSIAELQEWKAAIESHTHDNSTEEQQLNDGSPVSGSRLPPKARKFSLCE